MSKNKTFVFDLSTARKATDEEHLKLQEEFDKWEGIAYHDDLNIHLILEGDKLRDYWGFTIDEWDKIQKNPDKFESMDIEEVKSYLRNSD